MRWRLLAVLLLVGGGGVGCVERTIEITSEPSGALVYLNDEEVGRTPLEVPFTFYGVYDVRLEREGYEPKWTTGEAAAPWWDYPGPDLLAELVPGLASRVAWHYALEASVPVEQVDTDALLERAGALRRRAQ
ncbi:MAG: PEGA domain-containing protein [Planctomycetota bacterium]